MSNSNFTPQVKRVSKGSQEHLKLASGLMKEKRYDEALVEFEAIIKADPQSLPARFGVGNLYLRQKRFDEALTQFKAAIRIDPVKPQPYLLAGMACLRKESVDEALQFFESAINLDPKSYMAYTGFGQALLNQKKYDEAVTQFRRALRLNPRLLRARQGVAQAMVQQEKFPEALEELKSCLNIDTNDSSVYILLGRVYKAMEDYNAAVDALEKAINLSTGQKPAAQMELVSALIEDNQLDRAGDLLKDIPQAPQLAPRQHKLWGDLYHKQGQFKAAAEEYQAATLLASEEGKDLDEFESLDTLAADDERWAEFANSFRASAMSLMAERRSARRGG